MNCRKPLRILPSVLFVFLLFAILIRLTIRDRVPFLAAVYYATPPAIIALLAFISAYGFRRQKQRFVTLVACLLMAVSIWWWYRTSFRYASFGEESPSIRVVSWNISRGG